MAETIERVEEMRKLLVKHGFIKKSARSSYTKSSKGTYELAEGKISASDADVEVAEMSNNTLLETGYPSPRRAFRLIMESAKANIEEPYYWMLEHMRQDAAYPYVEKILDMYSSSEQSAFWGAAQSRIGIQQDRASNYLRIIGEMVKTLFQQVRELRILDEKLEPRKRWGPKNETDPGKLASADLALKAEYTDLVENRGGQVQPGSVFHLAQSVGYAILPDLFFNTHVYKLDDVDKVVDSMEGYNKNVKTVLKRKLFAFLNWKIKTDSELQSRRTFTLKYLRQHWNTIKLYMNWTKPYLRNVARMQMNPTQVDSPDIVGAFDTTVIELEILGYKHSGSGAHPCILATFKFRTRPEMSFQTDNYAHRGPLHVGRVEVTLRSYGWSKEQIDSYKKMKNEEDLMLLGLIDENVKAAMEALGEDVEKYLSEAGEKEFEEKKAQAAVADEKKRKAAVAQASNVFEPFVAVAQGFGELAQIGNPFGGSSKSSSKSKSDGSSEAKTAAKDSFMIYKNFKKSHGMLSW